jgi:hypothetical protein
MHARTFALPLLCLLVAAACPPEGGDAGPPPSTFACELGAGGGPEGAFTPLSVDATTELQLGFQGLSFATVRVRAEGDVPEIVEAMLRAQFEGQEEPLGAAQGGVEMHPAPGGALVSGDIHVPVNRGSFSEFVGREAEVALRVADDLRDPMRSCVTAGRLLFVDEDQCIHTGEEPICPDAGPADGGHDDGGAP